DAFFDTLRVPVPSQAAAPVRAAHRLAVTPFCPDEGPVGVSCAETTTPAPATAAPRAAGPSTPPPPGDGPAPLPEGLRRDVDYLPPPVFPTYRSEPALLRYLLRLADRDLALDRTMIPLGSCTMKLNATAEMEAITWPEFAELHPFAPLDLAEGLVQIV